VRKALNTYIIPLFLAIWFLYFVFSEDNTAFGVATGIYIGLILSSWWEGFWERREADAD